MMEFIIKKYEHYNRSLGKHIRSKAHYENELAKGGFVPYEKGCQIAETAKRRNYKPYNSISKEAETLMREAKMSSDKKGKLKCSDRMIDGMRKLGVRFDKVPDDIKLKGGFDAT